MTTFEAGPELDALVARALGLDVLGTTACVHHNFWYVPYDGVGNIDRPVYLRNCVCEFEEEYDARIFGHIALCLEPVQCYSTDDGAALAAVDALLDPIRWLCFTLNWHNYERSWTAAFIPMDYGDCETYDGETRALAICRAIVAMGDGA